MSTPSTTINEYPDLAKTAYNMALNMWRETHRDDPKIPDAEKFTTLVSECARALKGSQSYKFSYSWV